MIPLLAREGKAYKGDEANEIIHQILTAIMLMGIAQIRITDIAVQSHQWEEKSGRLRVGQLLCTTRSQGPALEKLTVWLIPESAKFH